MGGWERGADLGISFEAEGYGERCWWFFVGGGLSRSGGVGHGLLFSLHWGVYVQKSVRTPVVKPTEIHNLLRVYYLVTNMSGLGTQR